MKASAAHVVEKRTLIETQLPPLGHDHTPSFPLTALPATQLRFKRQIRVVAPDAGKLAGHMLARISGRAAERRKIDIAPNRRARGHISYPPLKAGTAWHAAATVTLDIVFLPG